MLMSKNDVNVVCCGSGNIREVLEDSSSEIIVIADPYKFSPRVDLESFNSFFSLQADVQSPIVNLSDAEPMLSFSPKYVLDLYAGTNGYFSSLPILRVDLMPGLYVGEAWRSAIEHFQNCMSKFFRKKDGYKLGQALHLFCSKFAC
eukprot:TRINITY_DN6723_c0_g1_i6.p1 TRINITY_DN6723_c0_g1~~TRINITY_DN6723_c0_g1_i6.p1  ORF type:complete len:146 (+),score=36.27 TRINITY_DN6723_c0_g1_i6:757-1194(+)